MILVLQTVITGIGATLVMDLWSWCQKHLLNVPPLNYALVGRWILWLPRGKFWHHTIVSTSRMQGEIFTGWAFHYLTGILFASIPFMLAGGGWFHEPCLLTGLLVGVLTLPAPFMMLQPAFGFGIAASRTSRPWLARLLSLVTHLVYGIGLYGMATVLTVFSWP
ncbi:MULTISPECIES: DUF2938 domain-containing protein [unclassified Symbiopectobacterium]|uniref:DUF2938 domain-containing protein n=1 Tax=unclassified Symbiopectobacterium TaxID=2794573 RepID=UPI00222661EA|nr:MULTISPECIES: DUF2938 domain-containing protein [unclassified Symbiopectobacterium]MCW2475799.1 DUF2938 domain-containing protein [Candidatus Symbiopectobacterium sp. NZEC151]MCW2481995.1 DUF2938 domain-containing protein [Candidatus Symbiopectobacterium sp. NZEC135]MCW2486018.1 DUF2938 domain-containing protein [Candidatus Symbiopectobacterium sp. NZEC127]